MQKLNIYAQHTYHDDAWIVGNIHGLIVLRDALDRAIGTPDEPGNGQSIHQTFATDGEGYNVIVQVMADDDQMDRIKMPYTDPIAAGGGEVWPWQIFSTRRASVEGLADPPETSDDRILRRALGVPMFKEGE